MAHAYLGAEAFRTNPGREAHFVENTHEEMENLQALYVYLVDGYVMIYLLYIHTVCILYRSYLCILYAHLDLEQMVNI